MSPLTLPSCFTSRSRTGCRKTRPVASAQLSLLTGAEHRVRRHGEGEEQLPRAAGTTCCRNRLSPLHEMNESLYELNYKSFTYLDGQGPNIGPF